jgi:hypothetical protein
LDEQTSPMSSLESRSITIKREIYEDVTDTPHFPIKVSFAGHEISFDDIYFDRLREIPAALRALEATRKGKVVLDGGFRVKICLEALSTGGISVSFRTEQSEGFFPGRCVLEGSIGIDGERVAEVIRSLERLFSDGIPVIIQQTRCSEPGDGALVDNRGSVAPGH